MQKRKILSTAILFHAITTMALAGPLSDPLPIKKKYVLDTMPEVCNYLPGKDIEVLHPFTTPLSSAFPDPNAYETYTGCHYQFFTDNDKPQLAVRLMKWGSKQEAIEEYKIQAQRHVEIWGISPERLSGKTDSVYFGIEPMDTSKCDECGLVAAQGLYTIYISFKGQYNQVTREGKKLVALQILRMMYDRIPGLVRSGKNDKQ